MIAVRGLTRYYGDQKAIEDLSFDITSNEVVGFLGLNGAGKTTTLKILAGLLLPTAGSVSINGQDMTSSPIEMRRQLGFLPEEPPLHKEMTVRDYLRFLGRLRGMPADRLNHAIEHVARRTSIIQVIDRVIGTLSFGYQKRVGIAQTIIHQPDLVILDEPITGLDPVQIVEMRKVIVGLKETCTVLVSSHILSEISQTCDRILVLHDGRLVAQGTEDDLSAGILPASQLVVTLRGSRARFEELAAGATDLVESYSVLKEREGLLELSVKLKGDLREDFVARMVGAGLGIRRLDDASPELEQIFLGLTQKEVA